MPILYIINSILFTIFIIYIILNPWSKHDLMKLMMLPAHLHKFMFVADHILSSLLILFLNLMKAIWNTILEIITNLPCLPQIEFLFLNLCCKMCL